ncbi:hypothetical protein N658DRAFT_327887 [Parathielavia hyrcaniae]|uniref:Uncharacterized protein n=1 Tax=Parathielavia hyrcaniae TaxID=113614 RepID=A0AAN6Q8X9_9PEZI|nr:hypothetical protein N658DRAFT_327887 [Parathielavia hyrcaniae]
MESLKNGAAPRSFSQAIALELKSKVFCRINNHFVLVSLPAPVLESSLRQTYWLAFSFYPRWLFSVRLPESVIAMLKTTSSGGLSVVLLVVVAVAVVVCSVATGTTLTQALKGFPARRSSESISSNASRVESWGLCCRPVFS